MCGMCVLVCVVCVGECVVCMCVQCVWYVVCVCSVYVCWVVGGMKVKTSHTLA